MLFTVILVAALAGVLAAWALAFAITDRAVVLRQLIGGGVVLAALVVQAVVVAVLQLGGTEVSDPVTVWGYIIVAILLLPGAAVWAFADRTRWSSVVLVIAAVAIMGMELRIWQVWSA